MNTKYLYINDDEIEILRKGFEKANPYRDGSSGRFTTGGTGGVSTGSGVIGGPGKDITKKYTLEKTFKDIIQKQDCP